MLKRNGWGIGVAKLSFVRKKPYLYLYDEGDNTIIPVATFRNMEMAELFEEVLENQILSGMIRTGNEKEKDGRDIRH